MLNAASNGWTVDSIPGWWVKTDRFGWSRCVSGSIIRIYCARRASWMPSCEVSFPNGLRIWTTRSPKMSPTISLEGNQQVSWWIHRIIGIILCISCSLRRDFGLDLVSLNLWRGRDHGLPGYNEYRRICGLNPVATFEELLPVMEKSIVDRMALVYNSVDEIDLFVGGLVERHLPGSMLGPVFSCIIADQFTRLKEGDRFYYEHGSQINSFTPGNLLFGIGFSWGLKAVVGAC